MTIPTSQQDQASDSIYPGHPHPSKTNPFYSGRQGPYNSPPKLQTVLPYWRRRQNAATNTMPKSNSRRAEAEAKPTNKSAPKPDNPFNNKDGADEGDVGIKAKAGIKTIWSNKEGGFLVRVIYPTCTQ